LNLAMIFGVRKVRVSGLSCGTICVILRLAVLRDIIPECNRQTQTHDDDIYRDSIASGNKKLCYSRDIAKRALVSI